MTDIKGIQLPWPVDPLLIETLQAIATETPSTGFIVSFRDPKYSAERGGYHSVEMMVSSSGEIQYITDFSLAGMPSEAELVKEIDFDFSLGIFQHFGREHPLNIGRELYKVWQKNFLTYLKMGVYIVTIEEI